MTVSGQPRILFVDDEANILEGLKRVLRPRQSDWDMAFHTDIALAMEAQRRQAFDVAVVDISMPVMSGLELIRALSEIAPGTLSIVLTGATDIGTAAAAINESSVFRFYSKPCATETLTRGIEQALTEHAARHSQQTSRAEAVFSLATLDRLPTGVIVVDRQLRVIYTNKQGAAFLALRDGLSIGPTGLCRAGKTKETAELTQLIALAIDGSETPRALSVSRDDQERPLSVVVARLPAEGARKTDDVAMMLVSAPERQQLPSVETVGRLFDLTEAEARLAVALGEGHRLEDAAERMGITISSARTYLKRIFSKTDVTRQAELVRLILAAPVLLDLGASKR